jgi:hypothetical protein
LIPCTVIRRRRSRFHRVIPGREPCGKIDASINFALGERARNP